MHFDLDHGAHLAQGGPVIKETRLILVLSGGHLDFPEIIFKHLFTGFKEVATIGHFVRIEWSAVVGLVVYWTLMSDEPG